MKITKKAIDFLNWVIIIAVLISCTLLAYFIKGTIYQSILSQVALIILISAGVSILVSTSIYGIIEKNYGKEENKDLPKKVTSNYKLLNKVFLIATTVCASCIFILFCLQVSPFFPLSLIVLGIISLVFNFIKGKVYK